MLTRLQQGTLPTGPHKSKVSGNRAAAYQAAESCVDDSTAASSQLPARCLSAACSQLPATGLQPAACQLPQPAACCVPSGAVRTHRPAHARPTSQEFHALLNPPRPQPIMTMRTPTEHIHRTSPRSTTSTPTHRQPPRLPACRRQPWQRPQATPWYRDRLGIHSRRPQNNRCGRPNPIGAPRQIAYVWALEGAQGGPFLLCSRSNPHTSEYEACRLLRRLRRKEWRAANATAWP
eukprot:21216-Chlamydomonas_euryale.AAC.4